jgi:hypothetical protein
MKKKNKVIPLCKISALLAILMTAATPLLAQTAYSAYVKINIGEINKEINSLVSHNNKVIYAEYRDELVANMPKNKKSYPNRYALIIGNENYMTYGMGPSNVEFACNDAQAFKEYVNTTFGVPESNILFKLNITSGAMAGIIERLYLILKNAPGKPELIFYYAGHGYPTKTTGESGLLPVDADPMLEGGVIPMRVILEKFATAKNATIIAFTDACYTGEGRSEPVLTAQRGIKYVPTKLEIPANVLLFAASQSDQTAFSYQTKKHGLFTWCLLNEIQTSSASVSWGPLFEKVSGRVAYESVKQGYREQRPTAKAGTQWIDIWRQLTVKK